MKRITEGAFAKLNLTLDVLDRRADGYHDIKSIMQTVSLHDDVLVDLGGEGWQVHCYRELLPPDAAWESACLDWKLYTKISQPPLRPYAELEYRLRRGETCRLQPYLARDSYALHYLSLHRERQLLEALLACSGDFSWILADCGSLCPRVKNTFASVTRWICAAG